MARRSVASIWAKALQRNARTMLKAGLRAGRKAVLKPSLKPLLKPSLKPLLKSVLKPLKKALATSRVAAFVKPQSGSGTAARAATGDGDWITGVAIAPAGRRRFHLYRPPAVAASDRLPLLVVLHGCTQTSNDIAASSRMNRLAARERCFVLYPEQDVHANAQRCWNWYDTRNGRAQIDVAIVDAAVDQVVSRYPVDANRIAVAGLSAGASLAGLLGLHRPLRYKAVVMHSGIPPGVATSAATALRAMHGGRAPVIAAPANGVPLPALMVLHGTSDGIVSVRNGVAAATAWAAAAGAVKVAPRRQQRGQRHPMQVTDFRRAGRVVVSLCEISGLGHAWSGGDPRQRFSDAAGPDASRLLWAFVSKQWG